MITDTRIAIETPEGVDLPLDPAGVPVRTAAWLIDFGVRAVVFIALASVLGVLGGAGAGILLVALFLLEWFYPVAFEVWRGGQTPGKKSLGIAVVHDDGTPIGFAASMIRNLLRVVDFLPFFYVAGTITALVNCRFMRVGDFAAGTMVIYRHPPVGRPEIDVEGNRPIPIHLDIDDQRALVEFAERANQLSPERQQELAEILVPIVGPERPVMAVKQMARSSLGDE